MTALPPTTEYTGAGRTNLQMKGTFTEERAFLAGLLGADGLPATALATLGALGAAQVDKAAAYTVIAADRGKLLNATTGSWTLTLPAAATIGAGFAFALRNSGTGVITLDANASETINGLLTVPLPAGAGGILICTGTGWLTLGGLTPDAQTSQTDSTAGRLMLVGGFGWGSDALTATTDLNALTISGNYRFASGATGAPETFGTVCHIPNLTGTANDGSRHQMAFGRTGAVYHRRQLSGGGWEAWARILKAGEAIATGAITATGAVSASLGLASTTGLLTLGGNAGGGLAITIADDAVGVITVPRQGGFAKITCNGANANPLPEFSGEVYFDAGTSLQIILGAGFTGLSANLSVVVTDLLGTTGTDGFVTISVQAGVLKIENRSGASRTFQVSFQ